MPENSTNQTWNLFSKICAELIDYLKNIPHSPEFIDRHKKNKKNFTRNRKLTFQALFLYFMNFINGSYQETNSTITSRPYFDWMYQ